MSTTATHDTLVQELAWRVSGNLEVTLFWDLRSGDTHIELRHAAIKEPISFRVPPGHALDAFQHPFPYLERQLWRDRR